MSKPSKPRQKQAKAFESKENVQSTGSLPREIQQIILNIFQSIIPTSGDQDLTSLIQEVKGHLFNRDFEAAFGKPEHTQAYAVRWSAARALGYANIFSGSGRDYLLDDAGKSSLDSTLPDGSSNSSLADKQVNIVCIGGGAGAEVIALAAQQRLRPSQKLQITAVDSGNWSQTLERLKDAVFRPAHLPSYASQMVRDRPENQALLGSEAGLEVTFLHQDALTWTGESMKDKVGKAMLVTIMFTLNELFTASLPKTTAFLLALTQHMHPASHLLVVDSPGSYSEVQIGKERPGEEARSKRYPMKWLLDHTLLQVATHSGKAHWEKIESEDSLWFRIEQKEKTQLKYPIELENMRYQLHCYKHL